MNHFIAALLIASALTPTQDQAKTIAKLEDRLMAPCCYSQTIRVHMSMEAEQMRQEVTDMVLAGKSEQDIIRYYKAKYGETILVVPDGTTGQIAFAVPVAVALSALVLLALGIGHSIHRRTWQASATQINRSSSVPPGLLEKIRLDVSEDF